MRSKTGFHCHRRPPEQIETKRYEGDCDGDQRNKADQAIKDDREQRARFVVRSFLEQKIALNNVSARATGKKLIVKHSNQEQSGQARNVESNLLHAKKNLPPDGGSDFDNDVG